MSQDVQEPPPLGWEMVTPEVQAEVERRLARDDDRGPAPSPRTYVTAAVLRDNQLSAALTELAAKDEKLAELEAIVSKGTFYPPYKAATDRADTAESKLRAVSEVLNMAPRYAYPMKISYEPFIARLRSIVENT